MTSIEKQESRTRNILLFQLGRSIKSKQQLRVLLAKREIDPEVFEPILDRFEEAGLINDLEFAKTVASSRQKYKGLSKSAIVRELKTKGIAEESISVAVADIDSQTELEKATELAIARASRLVGLERDVAYRRLSGFLARKGYSGSVISVAVKAAFASE